MWMAAISAAVTGAGFGRGGAAVAVAVLLDPEVVALVDGGHRARSCRRAAARGWSTPSVRPSHGIGRRARAPERVVLITLTMKTRNESAMMKAPMVETRFQKFQPRSGA